MAGVSVSLSAPSQVAPIRLDRVSPHPRLALRFKYDVDALAESIRSSVDSTSPNGQLNPGRVVPKENGEGYYVYIGVRRYRALKLLHDSTGDEKFGSFNAYVDGGLTELQMFIRLKAENEEGKGERQGLSVLEEVSGISSIRDTINTSELDEGLRRLLEVAGTLGAEKLRRLHQVEQATRTKFTLTQLEYLCKVEGDKKLYTTAASAAGFGGQDMRKAEEESGAAHTLDWFPQVFPEIQPEEEESPQPKAEEEAPKGDSNRLEVHEESVLVAPCPRCKGGNMFEYSGEVKVTHLHVDPDGERETVVGDSVTRVAANCSHCHQEFNLFVRHVGGSSYMVSSLVSKRLKDPDGKVEAIDLRYDFAGKVWQRIEGGKVTGPLGLAPKKQRG